MKLTWKKYLNKYFMKPISAKKRKQKQKNREEICIINARKIKIKIIVKC